MESFIFYCRQVIRKYNKDEMTVYAAQASFFIVIAAFPFIMLLLTLIQFIPSINKSDLQSILITITPDMLDSLILSVTEDLYTKSTGAILSITAITALWSASRGMQSMEKGLNRVFKSPEKRNFIVSRLICSGYTILFILVCIFSLLLLIFGTSIQNFINRTLPFIGQLADYIISIRTFLAVTLFIICFAFLYTYIPNKKQKIRTQLPGAIFSTVGWLSFSFGFSIYFNYFSNYSYMYGSLTAIVLLMLWLYFCICILFLGAEINYFYAYYYIAKKRKSIG